ncbi:flagellar hook-basal body complex protein FliE [Acetobacteraceae bacterium ESL0709]|nr:flagellar hook-basal body complex protein FliE [Acetobacteraceae bacterium ESL0697]MDF7679035.1 flagellar hook-basal body complex protein FliE [Acetobacteraceae bacterium ESL0709]
MANSTSFLSAQSFDAAHAYNNAQRLRQAELSSDSLNEKSYPISSKDGSDAVSSFSQVLDSALHGAVNTGKTAEVQTAEALSGKGNLSDVVASVEEAKLTLQTVTTLRDKFVNAYQEVMRMSI